MKSLIYLQTIFLCIISIHLAFSQRGFRVTGSQKRLALVVGNASYQNAVPLGNPVNDARSIAKALQNLGFEVIKVENASLSEMKRKVDDFGLKLKNYDVGLFYYAGHGIQSRGNNFLVPIEANLMTERQVEYDCIRADRVLSFMEDAQSKVNIVILDACRNNPFERSWSRSTAGNGLAFMNAPSGSLIAYATSPGSTASDGTGFNGLYTEALLKELNSSDLTILQMFQRVRARVVEQSSGKQIPWESTSLTGDFYFVGQQEIQNNTNVARKEDYNIPVNNKNVSYNNSSFKATWKTDNGNYWLYINGEHAPGTKSTYVNNDVIVYDPGTKTNYLMRGYRNNVDGIEKKADPLYSPSSAFYRSLDGSYWFYLEGTHIKNTSSAWVDKSLLVYDPTSNRHFILRDYSLNKDNKIHPAEEVFSRSNVFWKQKDGSYWFYVNGKHVSGSKSEWSGDDLIVTDPNTEKKYLLENYKNRDDNQLREAIVWN
ncbi:MAG: caspase family protein [Bacteroidota bacterium]